MLYERRPEVAAGLGEDAEGHGERHECATGNGGVVSCTRARRGALRLQLNTILRQKEEELTVAEEVCEPVAEPVVDEAPLVEPVELALEVELPLDEEVAWTSLVPLSTVKRLLCAKMPASVLTRLTRYPSPAVRLLEGV